MHSRSNWNLEVLVFKERGTPEYPEKNFSEQGREPTKNVSHIVLLLTDLLRLHVYFYQNCPSSESQPIRLGCVEVVDECSPTVYNCKLTSLADGKNWMA